MNLPEDILSEIQVVQYICSCTLHIKFARLIRKASDVIIPNKM